MLRGPAEKVFETLRIARRGANLMRQKLDWVGRRSQLLAVAAGLAPIVGAKRRNPTLIFPAAREEAPVKALKKLRL